MGNFELEECMEKKFSQIGFRLTDVEAKELEENAKVCGLDKSEYIRACLFIAKPTMMSMKKYVASYFNLIVKIGNGQVF